MAGGILRVAFATAVALGLLAAAAELVLRAGGARPRGAAELSRAIPDGWTGFRLRPSVSGEEAVVTNELGMHSPRSYPLVPPPGSLRVAVLGSSVAYGMGLRFADTIPAVVERELRAAGHSAEVLSFGTHAFTIVNVSAQLQAYVHQFRPDAVVTVLDLQVALPAWPSVEPAAPEAGSGRPGRWESLRRRGSETSALLALLDDPRRARRWVRRATGLPLRPRSLEGTEREPAQRPALPRSAPAVPEASAAAPPEGVRAWETRRESELAAPLAAMAAFCAERGIALYFVTPYGPYFDFTDEEYESMSARDFLGEAARAHGSERAALAAEVELVTRVVRRVAARGSAQVVDMLEASRAASPRTSPDFTPDGVHLTPAGNATLGRLVAARIDRDLRRPRGGGD
jgi:hypothetical protein